MSVFEWYSDKDDEKFEVEDEDKLADDVVQSGMKKLIDNYRNYNIADIYDEMESIREEIRHGNARDLQQAEQKIMSLFDKLEEQIQHTKEKHNSLARRSGDELDKLEEKLKSLAERVSSLSDKASSKKEKIEATLVSDEMPNHKKVHNDFYPYLSKPTVSILPNGVINITFGTDWMAPEKENFLTDMKAKALKKSKK
jgi:predicted nuclease with TOPRIM domain